MLNISPPFSFIKIVFDISECKCWLNWTTIFLYITFSFLQKGKKSHTARFNSQKHWVDFYHQFNNWSLLVLPASCTGREDIRYLLDLSKCQIAEMPSAFDNYHNNRQLISCFPKCYLLWLPIRQTSANILIYIWLLSLWFIFYKLSGGRGERRNNYYNPSHTKIPSKPARWL